jgi:hypothetical protein
MKTRISKKALSGFFVKNIFKEKGGEKVLGVSWIFQDKMVVLTNIKF